MIISTDNARFMTRRPRRGFALLIVLCVLALLSIVVLRLVSSGRSEIALTRSVMNASVLEAAADGGIFAAIFHSMDASSVQHWAADGIGHSLREGEVTARIVIRNEAGKINPNIASQALLTAVLQTLGMDLFQAQHLGNAIVDWREAQPSAGSGSPPGGSSNGVQGDVKAQAYRAAGLTYGPPATQFQTLGELRHVLGMTDAIFQSLLPHLSLAPVSDPDPKFADPLVKAALARLPSQVPTTAAQTQNQPVMALDIVSEAELADGRRFLRHAVLNIDTRDGNGYTMISWE